MVRDVVETESQQKTNSVFNLKIFHPSDKRSFEFIFPENNQKHSRGQNEKQSNESGVHIPKTLAGVVLFESSFLFYFDIYKYEDSFYF